MKFRKRLNLLICITVILLLLLSVARENNFSLAQPLLRLEAVAEKFKVDLKWTPLSQAEGGFNLYRRTDKGAYPDMPLNEFPIIGTNYTDEKGLIPGTTYCYKVRPVGKDLKEIVKIESNEACATPWGEGAPSVIPGKIVIKFKIGDKRYLVNGIEKFMDTEPEIKYGRTFLIIRSLVEEIGGKIDWNATSQKVTIIYKGRTIELWIGKSILKLNGVEKPIDPYDLNVKPYIKDGRTMLPLRACGENLDAEDILWDGKERIATLIFPASISSKISRGGLIGFNDNINEIISIVQSFKGKGFSALDCVITLLLSRYNPYIVFDTIKGIYAPLKIQGDFTAQKGDSKSNFNGNTYKVKGTTQSEMHDSMVEGAQKNGIGTDEEGNQCVGQVSVEFEGAGYTFRCEGSDMEEGCLVTTTCTLPKFNITLTMPEWDEEDAKKADAETQKCWSDFISALLTHEVGTDKVDGHLKIAQKYAKQVEEKGKAFCDKVMSYNGKIVDCKECKKIEEELKKLYEDLEKELNTIWENYGKEDEAYEKETDHGKKPKGDQKAPVFPCD